MPELCPGMPLLGREILRKALTLVCFCCCVLIQLKKVRAVEVTGSAVPPPSLAKATFPALAEHRKDVGKALSTYEFLRWPLENGADVLIVLLFSWMLAQQLT